MFITVKTESWNYIYADRPCTVSSQGCPCGINDTAYTNTKWKIYTSARCCTSI